jgi:hypothetical protein
MKSKLFSFLLVAVLLFVAVIPASAQLGTTDFSSFTIQNIDTIDASVTVQFIDVNGQVYQPLQLDSLTPATPNPFTLTPGSSKEIVTTNIPVSQLPAGQYSVVVFASAKVVAIVSVGGTGTRRFQGSYSGFDAGAPTVYLPTIYYNYFGWYSLISVQNLGSVPADVNVELVCDDGSTSTMQALDIPEFASHHFVLKTTVPPGWTTAKVCNGSARIVSTNAQNIAVTDNTSKPLSGNTISIEGSASGTNTVYVPALFYNYFGWNSSLGIRKIGSGATTVTITYSNGGSNTCALTDTQPSCLKIMAADHPVSGTFGATVTTDPSMPVIINAGSSKGFFSQAYLGFGSGASTDSVGIPTVMKNYFGWISSFTCQNVGTSGSTQLSITYSGYPTFTHPTVLDPGEQVEVNVTADTHITATSYQGGVTVEATNSAALIACTVGLNNPTRAATLLGDWASRYNGFKK